MHERRQAHRFRTSPGSDLATVTAGGRTLSARLLDTSATGFSLKTERPWEGKVGQKLEVDLNGEVCTLAEVARIEPEGDGTILGLRRLEDQHWEEADRGSGTIREMLRRRHRHRLLGSQGSIAVLLAILGMAIGFVVWRPGSSPPEPTEQKQQTPAVRPAPVKMGRPREAEGKAAPAKNAPAKLPDATQRTTGSR